MIAMTLLIMLTFASAFFSSSETALFSLSSIKLRSYKKSSDPKKRLISRLLKQPRELLVTIFMYNTLVNILIQNVASSFAGVNGSWTLKVGLPFFVTLIFGEIIPKNFGMENNVKLSHFVITLVEKLHTYSAPVRHWIIAVTYPVSRVMFFFLRKDKSISKDELHHVLATSQEHGSLEKDEAKLILGYLNLQTALVKEVMQPREDILFYSLDKPLSKLIHLLVDKECTRVPVTENGINSTLGMITARNFLLHQKEISEPADLKKLLQTPLYVPESIPAKHLLTRLEEEGEELALVVDEYGNISGLITQEDIIEIMIGEIEDIRESRHMLSATSKNELIVSGKMELSEFNTFFGANLTSEKEMVTLGGWITEQLEDIPKAGMLYETEHFLFQVLQADPNRIRKIYVRKLRNLP